MVLIFLKGKFYCCINYVNIYCLVEVDREKLVLLLVL